MKCNATQQSTVICLNNCSSTRKESLPNLDQKHVTTFDREEDRAKIINELAAH